MGPLWEIGLSGVKTRVETEIWAYLKDTKAGTQGLLVSTKLIIESSLPTEVLQLCQHCGGHEVLDD